MSDIIVISSDEENGSSSPQKKRIKLTKIGEVTPTATKEKSDVVVLSDEEASDTSIEMSFPSDKPISSKANDKYTAETIVENETIEKYPTVKQFNDKIENGINSFNQTDDVALNKTYKPNGLKNNIIDIDGNSSGKENVVENFSSNLTKPSSSKTLQSDLLENFLDICEKSIANSQFEKLKHSHFPVLRKYFIRCSKIDECSSFKKIVLNGMEKIKKKPSPASALFSFNQVLQYLKDVAHAESIEVTQENMVKLKKLEKYIKLLLSRIKLLEEAEVNFEDDDDSTYLQLDRYTQRLHKVHTKYCELLQKNPYNGRLTRAKLDFVDSEYNEINRAISKKYKNDKKFPSYHEMETFIRKISKNENLNLSESKIKYESETCFKKLGELLQKRRRRELYDAHCLYIQDFEDPSTKDPALDSLLKQNYAEGQEKIEKLVREFAVKEECGTEDKSSEDDSDKSSYLDSEDEADLS